MDDKKQADKQRLEKVAEALRKNNMEAVCFDTAEEVVPYLTKTLTKGCSAAAGGSVSLAQTGVKYMLEDGDYEYYNREADGISNDERIAIMHRAFSVDAYFASANAVSEAGEVFEVDGLGNRTAAIIYGPQKVYLIVGVNKIVADEAEAWKRISGKAAPDNAKRLECKTPCAATGTCADCKSDARICCTYVKLRQQRIKNRICVILVNEELGY